MPLSTLVATLLCMRGTSQQALVDKVFTALSADAQPVCGVSDRAFEAFKRLKHRLRLESVSGLSQHALLIDVAAKIRADNLAALLARAASEAAGASPDRPCNLAYTLTVLQRITSRLLATSPDRLER